MDSPGVASGLYPRSLSRELAFQFLYQDELNPQSDSAGGDAGMEEELDRGSLLEFAFRLFEARCQDDRNGVDPWSGDETRFRQWLGSADLLEFACSLIVGVRRHRSELDDRLSQAAENWSLGRMAATDRVVLRLGAYEILYADTPDPVAVDEAVELAKRFGGAQSGQFVNGILDRLMPGGKHATNRAAE